jgi:hypothetical protein
MLKRNTLRAAMLSLLVFGVYGVVSGAQNEKSITEPPTPVIDQTQTDISQVELRSVQSEEINEDESKALRSLKFQTQILKSFYRAKNPVGPLVEYLEKSGQTPVVTRESNKYTGEMVVIRTNTPPEGTRYFHTQAFTDEHGVQFIQHMSFEFRPSPEAMDLATSEISSAFQMGEPKNSNPDFKEWELPGGYTLWMKRLNEDDIGEMSADAFNVYGTQDVGAIRIAIEQSPHK